MDRDITSVHLVKRQAMLDNGEVIPISTMMDQEGEDTWCPRAARAIVAGPCSRGHYYADSLQGYNKTSTH